MSALLVPLFYDQSRNAEALAHAGMGVVYDKFELIDGDALAVAMREVLDNDRYTLFNSMTGVICELQLFESGTPHK